MRECDSSLQTFISSSTERSVRPFILRYSLSMYLSSIMLIVQNMSPPVSLPPSVSRRLLSWLCDSAPSLCVKEIEEILREGEESAKEAMKRYKWILLNSMRSIYDVVLLYRADDSWLRELLLKGYLYPVPVLSM